MKKENILEKNVINKQEVMMIAEYLEIIEEFLVDKSIHVERKIIEQKAKELGITFPEPMIEFYEFFGNNYKVLGTFHKFASINDICIKNDGLVFSQWSTGKGMFGILINDMPPLNVSLMGRNRVSAYYNDKNKWFADSISCARFFLNISCWQVLNTLQYRGTVKVKESIIDNSLGGLTIISEEKQLYKSYTFYSYFNTEKNLLACYFPSGQLLHVASMEELSLVKFENDTGLKLERENAEPQIKKSSLNQSEDKKISSYLKILERFLPKKIEHVDRDLIVQKARTLGITFPESMVEFYEFFGNNAEVLQGYHEFYKLEEIIIQNENLVFGEWHQGQSLFVIPLAQLTNKNPQIYQDVSDKLYIESKSCSNFFINIACWQVLNTFSDAAYVELTEEELNSTLKNGFSPINTEKSICIDSYRVYSYYSEKNNVIACYVKDTQEFHVASPNFLCLKKFEEQTGLKLDWA